VFLLLERDPLFGSYHFRRRNLCGPRKGKGHYGMASAEKNAHEVRRFMGLAGYYRRFGEGFSKSETRHHLAMQGGQVQMDRRSVIVHSLSLRGY
jgi:hypothetical protein